MAAERRLQDPQVPAGGLLCWSDVEVGVVEFDTDLDMILPGW